MGANTLLYLNEKGKSMTEDQMGILKIAECQPDTKALRRTEKHYDIVRSGLNVIQENLNKSNPVNRLGTNRHPRRKLFEKLDNIPDKSEKENQVMDDIHNYPLSHEAEHTLQRMFRRKASDKEILSLVLEKHRNETLVNKKESKKIDEKPQIICSMGLVKSN